MKRILGLAALMGSIIASATTNATRFSAGGRGASKRPWKMLQAYRERYGYKPNPEQPRFWHNISEPVQVQRFRDAQVKRLRKAAKLSRDTAAATNNNWAHGIGKRGLHLTPVPEFSGRLNPFYIAK